MIAAAMAEGIDRAGDSVHIYPSHCYRRPDAEIAVFYGFDENLRRIFKDYRALGRDVVYVDLGYFGRRDGGPMNGYHKVVVNGRHPTDYFQGVEHPGDRISRFGLTVRPWTTGNHIIVAGMSEKGANVEGFRAHEWEQLTIQELRSRTGRPLIYRPKPSWSEAKPIAGAVFKPEPDALPGLLRNCHAVVTHHSNVAIDALLDGIPAFTVEGAASSLCFSDLARIEAPFRPEGRERLIRDLAYTQWTPVEMRSGLVWQHLKSEGLIS